MWVKVHYLTNYFNEKYQVEFNFIVEEPKKLELGDISIPVFGLIKLLKKPLPEITSEIKETLVKRKLTYYR